VKTDSRNRIETTQEGVVLRVEAKKATTSVAGVGYWYKGRDGHVALGRMFVVLFILVLVAALVAEAAGLGTGATIAIMVLLSTTLVHALVLTPLARLKEQPPAPTIRAPRAEPTTVDALTHIPNRRGITTSLLDAMAYANRYSHPLSVALVDLDLLREINASLGRKAGDKALQTVASVFSDTLRMPDRAGRYGDEEFMVILPNTLLKNAVRISERIRDGVDSSEVAAGGRKLPVTVSIGVAQFRKGEDLERFLSRVDKALSVAKTSGRNRVATDRPA
jgi:diguanylate cyclase (GGDEF)-like protein